MNFKKYLLPICIISIVTCLVLLPDLVFFLRNHVYNYAISGFFIVGALLLIPVFLFYRNLKIYYWILIILVSLTPIMLMPVFYMNIQVNTEMVGLVMDTNKGEVIELLGWKLLFVVIAIFFSGWIVYKLTRLLPNKIPFKNGLLLSLSGILSFGLLPFIRSRKLEYYPIIARNTFRTYYPFRLADAISLLKKEMNNMENYKLNTANFKYGTFKNDSLDTQRKVHILVLGEAARYDHWQLNGYNRNTNPQLNTLKNIYTFHDVASGGSMTILSIPQLISRADASTYDRHKKEKSILAAFKEAGYYTAWISNQSKYGLTGNIGMHFNDGDTSIFCGHGENEGNFTGSFDENLLVKIDEVLKSKPEKDIFLIVHLIGSHWRYGLRYPEKFEQFKPVSDRNRSLITRPPLDQIINEYDNSILYTDYILKKITDFINQPKVKGTVLFVSDHGENLSEDGMYFHSYKPTFYTAKVPLFVWANNGYASSHPDILKNLGFNLNQKISSSESVFYTMIDLGRLTLNDPDTVKSLTNKNFLQSRQIILGDNGKLYNFSDLKK